MRKTLYILLALLVIALLPSMGFGQILTGKWQLSYIKDTLRVAPNGAARPDNGVQLTFNDNGTKGQFSGTFYCNGVAGDYTFGGNTLVTFTGRDTTNNPCYDEKTLWVYFSRIKYYKVAGNIVVFFDANGSDRLIFTKVTGSNNSNNSNNTQ